MSDEWDFNRAGLPYSVPWIDPESSSKQRADPVKGYTQRWMSETSYSTVKRTQDSALRSQF